MYATLRFIPEAKELKIGLAITRALNSHKQLLPSAAQYAYFLYGNTLNKYKDKTSLEVVKIVRDEVNKDFGVTSYKCSRDVLAGGIIYLIPMGYVVWTNAILAAYTPILLGILICLRLSFCFRKMRKMRLALTIYSELENIESLYTDKEMPSVIHKLIELSE